MIKQVKIGPYPYSVVLEDEPKNEEGDTLFGEVNCQNRIITLNRRNDHVQMTITLLHECIHVIDDEFGLSLGESVVTAMGTTLAMLFADNPELGTMVKGLSK